MMKITEILREYLTDTWRNRDINNDPNNESLLNRYVFNKLSKERARESYFLEIDFSKTVASAFFSFKKKNCRKLDKEPIK